MPANDTIGIISGLIGCVASIATLVPLLQGPFQRCCTSIEERDERLMAFEEQVDKFKDLKELAKRQKFEHQDLWFDKVGTFFEEYNNTMPQIDIENPRILFGHFPDYYGMYRSVRRIEDLSERLKWLTDEYERWVKKSPAADKEGEQPFTEFKDLSSFQRIQEAKQIRSLTCENKTNILGVCGAGGMGKTGVVLHVFNTLSKQYWAFDNCFWVEVSRDDDHQKLQMKIANEIGLDLPSDGAVSANADMIMKTLLRKGRFLLVLDNIWKAFSSEEIGIPPSSGQHTVIMTSRNRSVCREMASETIELKFLSNGEAEKLLRAKLDEDSIPEHVGPILKNVAEKCCGLPLAVVTAASHLRKLDLNFEPVDWEGKLKSPVMEEVFENLKPSYEHLKFSEHSSIQECFSYCTLQPRKFDIGAKELMEHWMWGGLFGEVERIEEHLAEAQEILDELKDACLLESTLQERGAEKVLMHPLIWDTAVRITKASGAKFFTKFGEGVGENFYKDWPEDVERVSLRGTDLKELRPGLRFDKLTTLLIQDNTSEIQFHDGLFNSFPNLTFLDLSNSTVSSLPDSISGLKNLYALFLRNCRGLKTLPQTLPELMALKALDVSGSPVKELPSQMHHLNKLLRLNVSQTGLTSVQHGLVNKLYNLQELIMRCDLKWASTSQAEPDSAAFVQDLKELKDLSVLEITFGGTEIFREYITLKHWLRLTSFKFCVGAVYNGKLGNNSLAFIKEFPNDPDDWLPSTTLELLVMHCKEETLLTERPSFENLRVIDVSYCDKLKYVFKRQSLSILKHLEEIVIQNCEKLEKVIEKDDKGSSTASARITMSKLQKLTLLNLPQLRSVSDNEMKCDSIRSIGVWRCENLEKFPVLIDHSKKGSLGGQIEVKGDRISLTSLEQLAVKGGANLTEATSINDLISRERIEAVEEVGPKDIKYID